MKAKITSLALLAMMMLSAVAVFRADALPAPSMWLTPTSVDGGSVGVGGTFVLRVWFNTTGISPGANSWQTYIVYNKIHLSYVSGQYTGTGNAKSGWSGALPTDNPPSSTGDHNATHGYALWGEVLKASAELSTLGSLVDLTFQVILAPGMGETLDSWITLDVAGIFSSSAADKNFVDIPLTFGRTHYTYAWTPPPPPVLSVMPPTTEWGPNPPPKIIGALRNVDVRMSIDAGWACNSVSFDLVYTNTAAIHLSGFSIGALWGVGSTVVEGVLGTINVNLVNPSAVPSGDVLLVTFTFMLDQQPDNHAVDPDLTGDFLLQNIVVSNAGGPIVTDPPNNGNYIVHGLILYDNPFLEVMDAVMGPGPAVGQLFNVTVRAKGVIDDQYLVGLDFRLVYDPTLITPVAAYEGPMFPHFAALQPGSMGTWFVAYFEPEGPVYPEHVLVGNLILPNETGRWGPVWPESVCTEADTVAIITFQVLYQSFGEPDASCSLDIIEQHWVHVLVPGADPQEVDYLGNRPPTNGTYTITTDWPGRMIDVYTQYPAPFGGQGLGMPSDMFWPQKEVQLCANVTYNYWPVQQKDVAFEIRRPDGSLEYIATGRTDVNGVACVSYRIPWPCDNPEELFGVWTVTVTVDIACVVVNDTLQFHFDYMVQIFSVTTDKFQYNHCDYVKVTINYGSHAQQVYPLLLYVVIKDELNVPIGSAYVETEVGGTVFCQYKNWTKVLTIHIPKFAFAGIAHVYVTAYNMLPTEGGTAWCPTFEPAPEIAIQPY